MPLIYIHIHSELPFIYKSAIATFACGPRGAALSSDHHPANTTPTFKRITQVLGTIASMCIREKCWARSRVVYYMLCARRRRRWWCLGGSGWTRSVAPERFSRKIQFLYFCFLSGRIFHHVAHEWNEWFMQSILQTRTHRAHFSGASLRLSVWWWWVKSCLVHGLCVSSAHLQWLQIHSDTRSTTTKTPTHLMPYNRKTNILPWRTHVAAKTQPRLYARFKQ